MLQHNNCTDQVERFVTEYSKIGIRIHREFDVRDSSIHPTRHFDHLCRNVNALNVFKMRSKVVTQATNSASKVKCRVERAWALKTAGILHDPLNVGQTRRE